MLRRIVVQAVEHVDQVAVGPDILRRWETVLGGLERDRATVAHWVDWVAKERMGKGYQERVYTRRGRGLGFRPHAYGVGCNMAFRTDAIAALGGFDPALDTGTPTGGGGEIDAPGRGLGVSADPRATSSSPQTQPRSLS